MDELFDKLFSDLGFDEKRNKIFDNLYSDVDNYFKDNNNDESKDFISKFKEYNKRHPNIIYFGFKFKTMIEIVYFYHQDYECYTYEIKNLKKFKISSNPDGSNSKEEWIFNDNYLHYLVYKVYNMKNPKFAPSIQKIGEESSVISLNEDNIYDFLANDWNIIYEDTKSINFDNILKLKSKSFDEKLNDNNFIKLLGYEDINKLSKDYKECNDYSTTLIELFSSKNRFDKKAIIFHNEDFYFKLKLIERFEFYYNLALYGNFYINFELFRNSKRYERLERIAYFLSFLFPKNYMNYIYFFEENIKPKITNKLDCWPQIIKEIVNYFKNNVSKESKKEEKISETNNSNINSNKDNLHLFNNINGKKFIIVFDNILTKEENNVVENIIEEFSDSKFIFYRFYPLINEFTSKKFIEYVQNPYDTFSPFLLFFANIVNFNSKSPKYNEEIKTKIIDDNIINNEMKIYDLIRIFNFKYLYVDTINYNSKSLEFLIKYIKYLNIQFDNKNKKVINISFKNKYIENEFKNAYENTMTEIKIKNKHFFKNINGQEDGYEIEKIIISKIIRQKEEFETLDVKSIFGLKELEKKKNIDYKNCNFFINQKSQTGEMFDFGIKIIKNKKQCLKLIQITSIKTEEEKEKISIEKMNINCSYLKKEFKENNLGEIDEIYFCIIVHFRDLETNKKNIEDLKTFCQENKYEFILFDIIEFSFYEKKNKELFQTDIFKINNEFKLDIINFDDIININKPLNILSLRKVKNRNEAQEDLNVNNEAKNWIDQNIKRIAKFEFIGNFNDLKRLNKDYFAFVYSKDENYIYFYNDEIVKRNSNIDNNVDKKLILILYSKQILRKNFLNSNEDEESIINNKSIEIDEEKQDVKELEQNIKKKGNLFKIDESEKNFLQKKRPIPEKDKKKKYQ